MSPDKHPTQPVPGATPAPGPTDDLETTARKLEVLAEVVNEGNSLALFTGLELSTPRPKDTESIAKSQMTPTELESYTDWKSKTVPMPPFDWENNKSPLPTAAARSLKKFARRAAAMDAVWAHDGATPEHASWLTFNMPAFLPLVKVVSRVQAAQKQYNQNDPLARLGPMEAAEIETARSAVYVAERNKERELQRIRQLTRSISRSADALNSRIARVEKPEESQQPEEPRVPVLENGAGGGVKAERSVHFGG
jgi:hypothetical protein